MQYVIIFVETPDDFAARTDAERSAEYRASWSAYIDAIYAAGVVVSGAGLEAPETATTVRLRGGTLDVQDGPFADTKEQLGGVFVIDVPDLDAAIAWAERSPAAATGGVEIRPVLVM